MGAAEQGPLVVGVSGASGAIYAVRLLDACREMEVETCLVVSRAALLTLEQETGLTNADLIAKAGRAYRVGDVGADIASGSYRTRGMVVAPCSVRTMSEIASGVTASLLTRAAAERASDVHLTADRPPLLRVDGALTPVPGVDVVLPAAWLDSVLRGILSTEQAQEFDDHGEVDLAYAVPQLDTSRAREVLDWHPAVDPRQALTDTIHAATTGRSLPTPPLRPRTGLDLLNRALRHGPIGNRRRT